MQLYRGIERPADHPDSSTEEDPARSRPRDEGKREYGDETGERLQSESNGDLQRGHGMDMRPRDRRGVKHQREGCELQVTSTHASFDEPPKKTRC